MLVKWNHPTVINIIKIMHALRDQYGFTIKRMADRLSISYNRAYFYSAAYTKKVSLRISESTLDDDFTELSKLLHTFNKKMELKGDAKTRTIQEHAAEITAERAAKKAVEEAEIRAAELARIKAAKEQEQKEKQLEMERTRPLLIPRIRIDAVTDDGIIYATAVPRKKKTIAVIKLCPETVNDYSIYPQGV